MIDREPNTIYLTGFAREAVLSAITKWMDPVHYCNGEHSLNLGLKKEKGSRYVGTCPWCRTSESLTMNIKTTRVSCSSCGESGDFLDLVKEERAGTTAEALEFLAGLVESYKKLEARRKAERREKRKQDKKRFGDSYEFMKKMGAAR